LAELQKEEVRTNIDEPSDQVLEKYLASVLRDAVASTGALGFPTLLSADTKASGSSSSSIATTSPYPSPRMLLKMVDLRSYVRRFRPAFIGRGAATHVLQGLEKIKALRERFYDTQLFRPSRAGREEKF